MAVIALEYRGCQWLVGKDKEQMWKMMLWRGRGWRSRCSLADSMTRSELEGDQGSAAQGGKEAGTCRMTWPHVWQKLLCYVSPDTRGVPDNCSNSHPSLLPYCQLLVYQIERTCTQGTHLKGFLPPPQIDQERFLSAADWADKNSPFSFQQFRTQPAPKQVGSF